MPWRSVLQPAGAHVTYPSAMNIQHQSWGQSPDGSSCIDPSNKARIDQPATTVLSFPSQRTSRQLHKPSQSYRPSVLPPKVLLQTLQATEGGNNLTLHANTKLKEKPNFGADLVWQTWGALRGEKVCGTSGICIVLEKMVFHTRLSSADTGRDEGDSVP